MYCVVGCDAKADESVLCQYTWISFIFILFEITKITLLVANVMNQYLYEYFFRFGPIIISSISEILHH
jgi:hypothetical protein